VLHPWHTIMKLVEKTCSSQHTQKKLHVWHACASFFAEQIFFGSFSYAEYNTTLFCTHCTTARVNLRQKLTQETEQSSSTIFLSKFSFLERVSGVLHRVSKQSPLLSLITYPNYNIIAFWSIAWEVFQLLNIFIISKIIIATCSPFMYQAQTDRKRTRVYAAE